MPQLSRLSAGRNNGDCTFSLKIEEILGLVYLPPPGANGSTITLAIRIVNLDDDYATTLALIDLPVPSEPPAADGGAKRKLHVVEAPPDSDDDVDGEPAEPAALQAIHVRRTNPGFEQEADLAELRRQLASSSDDAEAAQKQLLQAAEAALARDFVEQINAAKAQLEREFADRVAEAVRLADTSKDTGAKAKDDREQAEKLKKLEQELAQLRQEQDRAATAADAQIGAARKQATDAAEAAHAEAQRKFAAELTQLREQLESAATAVDSDIEVVRQQALEAAKTAHAKQIAELEGAHALALEVQDAATREQLKQEFSERLAEILSQAEEKTTAQAAAADKKAEEAETESARALAAATQEFESEISQLRQQLDATATETEQRQTKELAAVKTVHAAEIVALQSSHARGLEAQAARLEQENADRLADAVKRAEAKTEAALSAAGETWRAEETARIAAEEKKHQDEIAQLRQQLENTNSDTAKVHQQTLEAAEAEHAAALEQHRAATKEQLEQEFTQRLAAAQDRSEANAEARLTEARKSWDSQAETTLLKAREIWQAEEAARLATAKKELEDELSQLRRQLETAATVDGDIEELRKQSFAAAEAAEAAHAAEIAELKRTHASALETQASTGEPPLELGEAERIAAAVRGAEDRIEARLSKARKVWQADADAKLAAARETWKTEEAERLAAAKAAWQGYSHKGPSSRERAYRQQRNWMPRRSLIVTMAIVCLLGVALLVPSVRSMALDHSTLALSSLKDYIDSLAAPPPPVIEPAVIEAPQTAPASAATAAGRAVINVASANVRTSPSADANVVQSLSRGSTVSILGSEKDWQLIRFGEGASDIGWVHSDLVSVAPTGERTP